MSIPFFHNCPGGNEIKEKTTEIEGGEHLKECLEDGFLFQCKHGGNSQKLLFTAKDLE